MFFFACLFFLLTHIYIRSHWVANDGQRRPTKAHEDEKGPKRRVWRRLGPRCVSFSFILFYSYYYETRKPTAANDGQQRQTQVSKGPQQPMTANKGQRRQKGPKRRVWRRLGPRCVSFSFILFYSYYYKR